MTNVGKVVLYRLHVRQGKMMIDRHSVYDHVKDMLVLPYNHTKKIEIVALRYKKLSWQKNQRALLRLIKKY